MASNYCGQMYVKATVKSTFVSSSPHSSVRHIDSTPRLILWRGCLSFSKDVFNHHKCRSTASSLSMPLLPISVPKGIAIASHFARGLCTPQPQCWWREGFPCPNDRLGNAQCQVVRPEATALSMELHSGNVQCREHVF